MRRYLYYPGCSLEGTAAEYDIATRALMAALEIELVEIEEWTCCGATAAQAVSPLLAGSLAARNLALAEKMDTALDLLVPCSACYLNLKKAAEEMHRQPDQKKRINGVLAEEGLAVDGRVRVRHLLDVLSRDIGPEPISRRRQHPLQCLTVAAYYGCQCLRPYAVFDDPERPTSMTPLLNAAGAQVFDWAMESACCGASHMSTKMTIGLTLSGAILSAAQGADVIATVCPMCQMNLEAYQKKAGHQAERAGAVGPIKAISVVYLPQLLGLALGLAPEQVRLDLNLMMTEPVRHKLAGLR